MITFSLKPYHYALIKEEDVGRSLHIDFISVIFCIPLSMCDTQKPYFLTYLKMKMQRESKVYRIEKKHHMSLLKKSEVTKKGWPRKMQNLPTGF